MKVTDKKFLNVHQTISPLTATNVNGKHSDHHNGNSVPNVSSQLAAVINGVNAVNGNSSTGMSPTTVVTISAHGVSTANDVPMQPNTLRMRELASPAPSRTRTLTPVEGQGEG